MGYRWGAEGCHDLELVDTGTAVPRTGGAAIGDLVMVLPSARKKDGCVRPGEVGKFIKDDNDRQPFKIERLDGSNSDYYYEGDMRKATDAEIAASACTRTHASHCHTLTRRTDLTGNVCDVCRAPSIGRGWRCTPCDYDVCDSCIEHSAASITLSSANATLGAKVRHEEFGEGFCVSSMQKFDNTTGVDVAASDTRVKMLGRGWNGHSGLGSAFRGRNTLFGNIEYSFEVLE